MKKFTILFLVLFTGINSTAQEKFVKGYYIGNDNVRVECVIRDWGWKKCPKDFVYKLSETSPEVTLNAPDVREFGIYGSYRFISEDVMIDLSSDDDRSLSDSKDPVWSQQRIFLSVLIDGNASLYQYRQVSMERFFYRVNSGPIKQLICRTYVNNTVTGAHFITDNAFRKQLWDEVNIPGQPIASVEKLNYDKAELNKYFTDFNKQSGKAFTAYTRKKEKPTFHFNIAPGMNIANFTIFNDYADSPDYFFPTETGFRIGIEPELVCPYTHKKLSLILEPTFQYYNSAATAINQTIRASFYTLDFPIGARYYMFLGKGFNLYGEGLVNFISIPLKSEITIDNSGSFQYSGRFYLAVGGGVNWKWIGAGARFNSPRKIVNGGYWSSAYSLISFILRFRIF